MRAMLNAGEQIRVVALAGDADEAKELADRLRPTVTLLDDRIAEPEGTDLVHALARRSPVIALTSATEHRAISAMLLAPFQGCLVYGHLEEADLRQAVRAVAAGLGWLSPVAVAAVTRALRESARRGAG